jgi:hypothetical protein
MGMKYSLFLLESYFDGRDVFLYLATYDTLEEAKTEQKENTRKTIILPSY